MAQTKYGHLVKTIPPFKDYGPGSYRQGTEMDGKFFGYDLNLRYGTFHNSGNILPCRTQVCDYDQMMVWMGTNTIDLGYLGAQIDLSLGDEMEKHRITTSTAVAIPKGLTHGPIFVGPMENRFIMMNISITSKVKEKKVSDNPPATHYAPWMGSKYQENFKELAFKRNGPWHYGPKNPDTHDGAITDIFGTGFEFNMSYESMNKAPYRFTPEPDKPHVHPYTEFLIFIGCDCNDLSEFPAEVEMCMGEEMEIHRITKPTVAIQPKGHPHCPVRVLKQSKPWIFIVLRPWGHGGDIYSGGAATAKKGQH
ncbi:MAG: hypothetical protein JXA46_13005 [Dehalococcoidales bacterium]|nr:hypothetical protein [Dehalococcoidales bacterium]